MDSLRFKIKKLKEKLNMEIEKRNHYLQEEKILELSNELDKLINEYLKMYKNEYITVCR